MISVQEKARLKEEYIAKATALADEFDKSVKLLEAEYIAAISDYKVGDKVMFNGSEVIYIIVEIRQKYGSWARVVVPEIQYCTKMFDNIPIEECNYPGDLTLYTGT